MFVLFLIIFQIFMFVMFAAFVRIDTNSTIQQSYYNSILLFLTGFAILGASKHKLALSSIFNLILIISVSIQFYLIWGVFWNSCFLGFYTNFKISSSLMIQCQFCALCVLLTFNDIIGKFSYDKIFLVTLLQTIGFALNSAIINYGLKGLDGGGDVQIFLFSSVFVYGIWFLLYKIPEKQLKKYESNYKSHMYGLIGLLFIVYGWVFFNVSGSLVTLPKVLTQDTNKQGLVDSAAINTIVALSAAIISSLLFLREKLKINVFIECVLSGGIIISSCADILIDPVVSLLFGACSSIATIFIFNYFGNNYYMQFLPNTTLRLFFSLLGGILTSILVGGRSNRTPILFDNAVYSGGMTFVGIIVTILIGFGFGCLGGLILQKVKLQQTTQQLDIIFDELIWQTKQQQIIDDDQNEKKGQLVTQRIRQNLLLKDKDKKNQQQQLMSYSQYRKKQQQKKTQSNKYDSKINKNDQGNNVDADNVRQF